MDSNSGIGPKTLPSSSTSYSDQSDQSRRSGRIKRVNDDLESSLPPAPKRSIKVHSPIFERKTARVRVPGECLKGYKIHRLNVGSLKEYLESGVFSGNVKPGKSKIPNAGKGVFAQRDFKRGEVIGCYTGKLVKKKAVTPGNIADTPSGNLDLIRAR